jgi:hypothetical protein
VTGFEQTSIDQLQYYLFSFLFSLIAGQVSYPKKKKKIEKFDPPVINFILKVIVPARLSIYLMMGW